MSEDPAADFITAAEKLVQEQLLVGEWFQNFTVLTNADGDLVAKIDQALAALGIFAVIRVAEGPVPVSGDTESWDCYVVITENPILNRVEGSTGKTARMAVQKIVAQAALGSAVQLQTAREMISDDGSVVWQLNGIVQVGLLSTD